MCQRGKLTVILDESNPRTRHGLYYAHNRWHEGQIVLVWSNGKHYSFSFHDDDPNFSMGDDWVCIGELTWRVDGNHFVNTVGPLHTRSAEELAERAKKTTAHKAYRAKLYKQYSLAERLTDLKT